MNNARTTVTRLGGVLAAGALLVAAGCGVSEEVADSNLTTASFGTSVLNAQEDNASAHMVITADIGGLQPELEGDISVQHDEEAADLAVSAEPITNGRLILTDKVLYVQLGGLTPGDTYVKADPNNPDDAVGQVIGDLLRRLDLSNPIGMFETGVQSVERGGVDRLDGVDTRMYTVTVDVQKAAKAPGFGKRDRGSEAVQTLEYDVWVDADDLVRQVAFDADGLEIIATFSDWGKNVDIEAPPADQVNDQPLVDAGV